MPRLDAQGPEPLRETLGQAMDAGGDGAQPLRSVIHGIEAGDVRQQGLRGADVRGGALAPDMLLACLQRHAIGRVAVTVHRQADDAPRGLPRELGARREERRMRSAVPQRHAEALRVADHDVGPLLAGRRQQRQRQQVAADRRQRAGVVGPGDDLVERGHFPVRRRILQQHAEHLRVGPPLRRVSHLDLDAQRFGPPPQHVDRLRETAPRDEEPVGRGPRPRLHPVQQRHRLGGRRRFVEQRRVGDRHAGEVGHHGLEVQQRFQTPLGDLGLIRRIGGVPAGILEDVPQNDAGGDAAVVAETDERPARPVAAADGPDAGEELGFGLGPRHVERRRHPDVGRQRLVDQGVERGGAGGRRHGGDLAAVRPDVPVTELVRARPHYATSSAYAAASSSAPACGAPLNSTTIIQAACASSFTVSGRSASAVFTSTTRPASGQ